MIRISFTYEDWSQEALEHGDCDDCGVWLPGGYKFSIRDDVLLEDMKRNPDDYEIPWTVGDLRRALETAQSHGITEAGCDDGMWHSATPDEDYSTGTTTSYTLHVDDITSSTRKRIDRLLNGKPLFG